MFGNKRKHRLHLNRSTRNHNMDGPHAFYCDEEKPRSGPSGSCATRIWQSRLLYSVVGLRNSHDKSYPAGLVVGSRVFVCDNLAFSGEISVARKHTTNILRDLQGLTCRAVGFLAERWMDQEKRIDGYKGYEVDDARAHDLIVRAIDARVISTTQLPKVIHEWREPRHPEFGEGNAWLLFNSFTEVLKEVNPFDLPRRTQALHGLFDHQVGLLENLAATAANN
jgi:hypothetical protein